MKTRALLLIVVAVALGLLEAAWTGPGRGGPTNTWLGVVAIYLIFMVFVGWKVYLIPGAAILEEGTHLFVGYGWQLPTWNVIFSHWSTSFVGFNFFPWLE